MLFYMVMISIMYCIYMTKMTFSSCTFWEKVVLWLIQIEFLDTVLNELIFLQFSCIGPSRWTLYIYGELVPNNCQLYIFPCCVLATEMLYFLSALVLLVFLAYLRSVYLKLASCILQEGYHAVGKKEGMYVVTVCFTSWSSVIMLHDNHHHRLSNLWLILVFSFKHHFIGLCGKSDNTFLRWLWVLRFVDKAMICVCWAQWIDWGEHNFSLLVLSVFKTICCYNMSQRS
jgi:hypothetical protein